MKKFYLHFSNSKAIRSVLSSSFLIALFCVQSFSLKAQDCSVVDIDCGTPNIFGFVEELMIAGYHSVIYKTAAGYAVSGSQAGPLGQDINSVTNITTANGYDIGTATVVHATVGSTSVTGNEQFLAITDDDKLYAWGLEDVALETSLTTGMAFDEVALGLPPGVTAADVLMFKATHNIVVILTTGGSLWMTGDDAILTPGGSTTTWNQVEASAGVPLTGIVDIDIANQSAFAVGSAGQLYTWGVDTFLGNGTAKATRAFPTLMTNPVPGGVFFVQAELSHDSAEDVTYYILGSNSLLYVLGENQDGYLAQGTTVDSPNWLVAQNETNTGDLTDVRFISATDNNDNKVGVSVLLADCSMRSWGNNSSNMIGGSGAEELLPVIPNGFVVGTDINIYVENGGHLTPYLNANAKACNVGHNLEGGFGDGTTTSRSAYDCNVIDDVEFCASSTLPVELVGIKAEQEGTNVLLTWATASESNNSHFDIEFSRDALNWTTLGTVLGSGNSSGFEEYEYEHADVVTLSEEILYYRLKQVDLDGVFTYSDIAAIKMNASDGDAILFPNPAYRDRLVTVSAKDIQIIEVYNVYGQLMRYTEYNDVSAATISTEGLTPGQYFVRINNKKSKALIIE